MSWKHKAPWLPAWAAYFYAWYRALSWESPTVTWIGPSPGGVASGFRALGEAIRGLPELLNFLIWFLTLPLHPYPEPYV